MAREKPGTSPCCMKRSADLYKQATCKVDEVYEGANIVALTPRKVKYEPAY